MDGIPESRVRSTGIRAILLRPQSLLCDLCVSVLPPVRAGGGDTEPADGPWDHE